MKKTILLLLAFIATNAMAQSPFLSAWLRNTTITARHYDKTSGALINDATIANVQSVKYNTTNVYISTTGVPSYITGPFLDGNPSVATSQNAIFKFPLVPTKKTGTPTATTAGNIGIFINGVALYDYRDGVAWNNTTSALCGGPGNPTCPGGMGATQAWNRDAIVAEKAGFDCAKGHPAMGNYHHHQNPSAFNLDLNVISTVCNLYAADGLYVINPTQHAPLLGFAYDGFPIYGAYAYSDTNGTGAITRMKSSYQLRNITTRTAGAPINATYPLGYFREDYEYVANAATDYLDDHNGRYCRTPEFPAGTYAYFCTVDANHNSAYPYVVGPTFYGNVVVAKVTTIPTPITTYTGPILPVESIDITGTFRDKETVIKWTTLNEINVSKYEIESSNDGKEFKKIGSQKSVANVTNTYTFIDESNWNNTQYYRLKIVDENGKYSYSKIISLHKKNNVSDISIFSNPVSNLLILQAKGITKNSLHITLYNQNGQAVKQEKFLQGSTICYMETTSVPNGIYFVAVSDGASIKTFKVFINH
jgi:YHYH protein/Secretion system C-terminal sorting domain